MPTVLQRALSFAVLGTLAGCLLVDPLDDLAPDAPLDPPCPNGADARCTPCAHPCAPGPNTTGAACVGGACKIAGCVPGFDDCDGQFENGCETETQQNASACGRCGQVCAAVNGSAVCTGGLCQLTCRVPYQDCDGNPANGCESDTLADPKNCNTCGHACASACRGYCRAVTLVKQVDAPTELVVGSGMAYFAHADSGSPGKVSLLGGPATAVSSSGTPGRASFLSLSKTDLYWYALGDGTIYRAPLPDGGAAKPVIAGQTVTGTAADDNGLFWSEAATKEIRALDGTSYRTVTSSPTDGVGPLVLDSSSVYFVASLTHKVFAVARAGGAAKQLFDGLPNRIVDAIAVASGTVYIATHDASGGTMWSVQSDGTALVPLFSMSPTKAVATDGVNLFYADPVNGLLQRSPTSGALSGRILEENLTMPSAVGLDSTHVYWTNLGGAPSTGTVMKIEKAPPGF